jgi:RNA polymerase sigma factor (sigma-70 family)
MEAQASSHARSPAGDERLATLVGRGSERAFTTLYRRYHQALYRYCRSIVRDEADAQDALQSTFMCALAALRRGQRKAPLRPWLFRIAHNEAISLIRRRGVAWEELSDAAGSPAPSAEDRAGERERLSLLLSDVAQLPDRQRGALMMRELNGLSHEEVGLALGMSASAAKQAIFEARTALAELAEGRAMTCDAVRRIVSDGDRRVLRGRRVRSHLRHCPPCAAFAEAIPARRAALRALAPPLAPAAGAGVLARVTAGHGGSTAAATKLAGLALATKAVVAVAIVAGTAAGVGGALSGHAHRASVARRHTAIAPAPARGVPVRLSDHRHAPVAVATRPPADVRLRRARSPGATATKRHAQAARPHPRQPPAGVPIAASQPSVAAAPAHRPPRRHTAQPRAPARGRGPRPPAAAPPPSARGGGPAHAPVEPHGAPPRHPGRPPTARR